MFALTTTCTYLGTTLDSTLNFQKADTSRLRPRHQGWSSRLLTRLNIATVRSALTFGHPLFFFTPETAILPSPAVRLTSYLPLGQLMSSSTLSPHSTTKLHKTPNLPQQRFPRQRPPDPLNSKLKSIPPRDHGWGRPVSHCSSHGRPDETSYPDHD